MKQKEKKYLLVFVSVLGSMGWPFSSSLTFGFGPRFFGTFGSDSFSALAIQELFKTSINVSFDVILVKAYAKRPNFWGISVFIFGLSDEGLAELLFRLSICYYGKHTHTHTHTHYNHTTPHAYTDLIYISEVSWIIFFLTYFGFFSFGDFFGILCLGSTISSSKFSAYGSCNSKFN